jgi:outer membrane receptor protein involved in Fe transport
MACESTDPSYAIPSTIVDLNDTTTTAALYFNAEYDFFNRLTLNVGLRYNNEERESSNTADAGGVAASLDGGDKYTQLLPSASLTYRFTDNISAGLKYGRGYRSGGVSVAPFAQIARAYDEEFTNNYEVFFRSRLLDDLLVINGNVYYTEWFDMQLPVDVPGGVAGYDTLIDNAGEAELKGFELEATINPMAGLTCFVSLGYAHTEFKDYVSAGVDYSGQALPNAPEWNFAIGANYNHPSGFHAGATYRWTDNAYTDIASAEYTEMSTRNILDAKIGYRAKNWWSAYLWVTNLLDDDYELYIGDMRAYSLNRRALMNNPRTVGLGVEIYW